jgi:hypothetical protein
VPLKLALQKLLEETGHLQTAAARALRLLEIPIPTTDKSSFLLNVRAEAVDVSERIQEFEEALNTELLK